MAESGLIEELQSARAELARLRADKAVLVEALRLAFSAVNASYEEAQCEWQHAEIRGNKAAEVVRSWRAKATETLNRISPGWRERG